MRTIDIETINFKDQKEASKNENYPNSGFFITRVENGTSDLRLVDKTVEFTFCVIPENVFNNIFNSRVRSDLPAMDTGLIQESIKYDGDFILEFARILLNRK